MFLIIMLVVLVTEIILLIFFLLCLACVVFFDIDVFDILIEKTKSLSKWFLLRILLPFKDKKIKNTGFKFCRKCYGSGYYSKTASLCSKCNGTGKIDWVQAIISRG